MTLFIVTVYLMFRRQNMKRVKKTNSGPEKNLLGMILLNLCRCNASIVWSQWSPTFPVSGPAGSRQPGRPTPGQSGPVDTVPHLP